ncbi:hypothetical protein BGZ83_011194 [Gryganskiella cystojenkinii]|nr:hypothetical protein BGZ83_011194 [Gryganskiella cystojenkinii]
MEPMTQAEVQVVPKRGRGRPRKVPIPADLLIQGSGSPTGGADQQEEDTVSNIHIQGKSCESCNLTGVQILKLGRLNVCKVCYRLMRAIAGSGRLKQQPVRPNTGFVPDQNHVKDALSVPLSALPTDQIFDLTHKLGQGFTRQTGESRDAQHTNAIRTCAEAIETLPSASVTHINSASVTQQTTELGGGDKWVLANDRTEVALKEPKKVPSAFHSIFPSAKVGKKRGRKPKALDSHIPPRAIAPRDNMFGIGSNSRPMDESNAQDFHTTGAFLTRTASKLLGGQASIGQDANIHGYTFGRPVKVRHVDGTWYFGTMAALEQGRIRVRFDEWGPEWDEWITSDSRRLSVLTETEIEERKVYLDHVSINTALNIDARTHPVTPNRSSSNENGTVVAISEQPRLKKNQKGSSKRKLSSLVTEELVQGLSVTQRNNTSEKDVKRSKHVLANGSSEIEQWPPIDIKSPLSLSLPQDNIGDTDVSTTAAGAVSLEFTGKDYVMEINQISPWRTDSDGVQATTLSSPLRSRSMSDTSVESTFDGTEIIEPPLVPSPEPQHTGDGDSTSTERPQVQSTPGNPINLGLQAEDTEQFQYDDEESEIRRIIHRVLNTGLVLNSIVIYPPEEAPLLTKQTGLGPANVSNGGGEGEDTYKRTKTKEKFVAILEARQEALANRTGNFTGRSRDITETQRRVLKAEKDPEHLRKMRELATRNMCHSPMVQFDRQVIYNESDRRDILNNTFERSKVRLTKVLSDRKQGIRRPGSLSSRILGISGAGTADLLFNEAGYIETPKVVIQKEESLDIKKAKQKQRRMAKLLKERRLLKSMLNPHQNQDDQDTSGGTFQSLRSLTRSSKGKRVLVDNHITFLKRKMVPGTRIRARDKQLEWLSALIKDVRNSRVLVHYEGYHAVYDEWIDINSERLQYDPRLAQPIATPQFTPDETPIASSDGNIRSGTTANTSPGALEETNDCSVSPTAKPDDEELLMSESAASTAEMTKLAESVSAEEAAMEVNCVQCRVKISQFRYDQIYYV